MKMKLGGLGVPFAAIPIFMAFFFKLEFILL
jgi:hypothetical protein